MAAGTEDAGLGAVPLASLEAVALDTETTGLDPGKDRVLQVGAVALTGCAVDAGEAFDRLVDPDMPIPPSSTAIHGISDEDVRSAAKADEVLPALARWIGSRVVIGYAIGFDLAMLKAEHDRRALAWRPYRSLCVRQLAALFAPGPADPSLDAIAKWLGVGIDDRHSALGDASAAAAIFVSFGSPPGGEGHRHAGPGGAGLPGADPANGRGGQGGLAPCHSGRAGALRRPDRIRPR